MINYVMLVSRQGQLRHLTKTKVHIVPESEAKQKILTSLIGKVRLAKWFQTLPTKTKAKIVKDVTQLVLARRTRMCNFLEYKGPLSYASPWQTILITRVSPLYHRYQSHLPEIRVIILHMLGITSRQRINYIGSHTSICRGFGPVFR